MKTPRKLTLDKTTLVKLVVRSGVKTGAPVISKLPTISCQSCVNCTRTIQ